ERARPRPGDQVIEVRRRLGAWDPEKHVMEARAHEGDREQLVEPVALAAERREADRRADRGNRDDGEDVAARRQGGGGSSGAQPRTAEDCANMPAATGGRVLGAPTFGRGT